MIPENRFRGDNSAFYNGLNIIFHHPRKARIMARPTKTVAQNAAPLTQGALAISPSTVTFDEKMQHLSKLLREEQAEGARLDAAINANLTSLGYGESFLRSKTGGGS